MEPEKRDFNLEAATWDEKPQRVQLANDVSNAILAEIPFDGRMKVLDFGCGTGLITLRIRPRVYSITGVDTSDGMLKVLKDKVNKQDLTNVKTHLLDPERGGLPDGPYDAIVSSMTLHHINDIATWLVRFHDLLVPGGRIALADLDPDGGLFHEDNQGVFHNGFDRETIRWALERAGFTDIRDRTAAEVVKPSSDGGNRKFTVFLLVGRKKV